jgi:acetyl-CoA synthetase (ADP-forming)
VVETIRALELNHLYFNKFQQIHTLEPTPEFDINLAKVRPIIKQALSEDRDLLLSESLEVLERYGIPTVRSVDAMTVSEARAAAEIMGYPVAIKIVAEQISHKSDVGGVQLNLRNGPALAEAFEDMMSRIKKAYPHVNVGRVLVQPMVTGGRELILGGRQDPQFGPVVLVGLGGVFVEIFEEVQVRVAPINQREAQEMIENLRGYGILRGARGQKKSDVSSVVDALMRLSQLLCDFPEIEEIDINPLRVFHERGGCTALDARMVIAK